MVKKVLGIILTFVSIVSIGQLLKIETENLRSSKGNSFSTNVESDLSELRLSKRLPSGWDSIKTVTFLPADSEQKPYLANIRSLFPINKDGALELIIDVVEIDEEEQKSIILQMSLIDLNSRNKIWELGRTYRLNGIY